MKRPAILVSTLLLALALLVGGGVGQPSPSLGPLNEYLLLGADEQGVWRGAVEDGRYVLSNDRDPNAIKFFFVAPASCGTTKKNLMAFGSRSLDRT